MQLESRLRKRSAAFTPLHCSYDRQASNIKQLVALKRDKCRAPAQPSRFIVALSVVLVCMVPAKSLSGEIEGFPPFQLSQFQLSAFS
jgi:hypothetical protein